MVVLSDTSEASGCAARDVTYCTSLDTERAKIVLHGSALLCAGICS